MVIVVVLHHEGRRGLAEKHEDVGTPWTIVVDDDHWSATWTSDHRSSSTTGGAEDVELLSH